MKQLLRFACLLSAIITIGGCERISENPRADTASSSKSFEWIYGYHCLERDRSMDTYEQKEADASGFVQSSEGASVIGYYTKNGDLRIIEVGVYQSRHKVICRFYPLKDAVAIICYTIVYATDAPLHEVTEDDMHVSSISQFAIQDGQVHCYLDEREPMLASDNTWYAEIYAKAVAALSDVS